MTSPLAYEKVWFEKCKYEEAERQYFENLAKLLVNNGLTRHPAPLPSVPLTSVVSEDNDLISDCIAPPQLKSKFIEETIDIQYPHKEEHPLNIIMDACKDMTLPAVPFVIEKEPSPTTQVTQPQIKDEKRFKPKEAKEKRNKADKKGRDRRILKDDVKGSPNTPLKNSLAGEVAKARQHIKNSLECMDGIAALATNVNVELVNRLNSIEKKNAGLAKLVADLQAIVKQLETQVQNLEKECKKSNGSLPADTPAPAPTPVKKGPVVADGDDNVDIFASDSEEESEAAKRVKEERLAAYAAKKAKKPVLIAKSNIILDVKPWDDETDMKAMESSVRAVEMDGLLWGASKLVPLAYGIHKLQISCVVEDDKVSVDLLQEKLEEIEDYVQSVDIAAFNKV